MNKNIKDIFDCYSDDEIAIEESVKVSAEQIFKRTKYKTERENKNMKRSFKKLTVGLIAAATAIILSITAFAAYHFLSPAEVAKEFGDIQLADFFAENGGTKFDITPQESKGYSIGLLGIASGKNLSSYTNADEDKTYIVGFIAKSNGEKLTDFAQITVTPLVSGYEPYKVNIFSLNNGGRQEFIKDGVEYFIIECENLNIFADRTVYIAAYEGLAPGPDKFILNSDGSISYAEKYSGIKAMFTVPLDKSKADPKAAHELLINRDIEYDINTES